MDKFLMSSPRQLSQPFDMAGDSLLTRWDGIELNDNGFNSRQLGESNGKGVALDSALSSGEVNEDKVIQLNNEEISDNDSFLGELVPVSNNERTPKDALMHPQSIHTDHNLELSRNDASERFLHSRNLLLADGLYDNNSLSIDYGLDMGQRVNYHQSKLSNSSLASISQEPPVLDTDEPSVRMNSLPNEPFTSRTSTAEENDFVPPTTVRFPSIKHSASSNTLRSAESIPGLSSSISNPSLLDSPSSFQRNNKHYYNVPLNSNLYSGVVADGGNLAGTGPVPSTTPRRPSRNKSISISSNNFTTPIHTSLAAFSPAGGLTGSKVTKTPHGAKKGHERSRSKASLDYGNSLQGLTWNHLGASPKFQSPIAGETEDLVTPLPTPRNQSTMGTFGPQSEYFSTTPAGTGLLQSSMLTSLLNYLQRNPSTSANESLQSIRIEDQHDDAFQELKKAKSYSNFNSPSLSRNLSNPIQFINEANVDGQYTLNQGTKGLSSGGSVGSTMGGSILSNNSTPGNGYSPPSQNLHLQSIQEAPYSGAVRSSSSTLDLSLNSKHQQPLRNQTIDLLLPQIITSRTDNPKNHSQGQQNQGQNQARVHGTQFSRSYPASIDLASIATSPLNSSLSAPATSSQQFANFQRAAMSNDIDGAFNGSITGVPPAPDYSRAPLTQDGNKPIKVSYKTDKADPKKKHLCPICQARFQRPEHVKRHLKSHSSEKPFECDEPSCGKCFNRKDNLKAHLKKMHGRKF